MNQRWVQLKPYENHTKTTLKSDGPTKGTIQTIRKPFTTIGKPYENDPESRWTNEGRRLKAYETSYKTMRKPYENNPESRWTNEGSD